MHGVDLMNNVFGVLFKSFVNEVRVMAHIEQMFHIFHILLVLVFERNDQAKTIMEFAGQFILFNYDPSPAMACFSLRMMTQIFGKAIREIVCTGRKTFPSTRMALEPENRLMYVTVQQSASLLDLQA